MPDSSDVCNNNNETSQDELSSDEAIVSKMIVDAARNVVPRVSHVKSRRKRRAWYTPYDTVMAKASKKHLDRTIAVSVSGAIDHTSEDDLLADSRLIGKPSSPEISIFVDDEFVNIGNVDVGGRDSDGDGDPLWHK